MFAKIMQASGNKACFQFPERSLSYAKIMQARAVRACSYTAERSLSYAKIMQGERNSKTEKRSFFKLDTAEPKLILCKDNLK